MKTITMRSINCRTGVRFTWDTPDNKRIITRQEAAKDLIAKYPEAKISKTVLAIL